MTEKHRSLHINAPAKINLGLYITDKRPDGYHELCSIFLPVELFDVLDLKINTESDTLKINVSGPFAEGCPTDERNIVFKVYNKLLSLLKEGEIRIGPKAHGHVQILDHEHDRVPEKTDAKKLGLDLNLVKNIPSEAGLGGGSSDAAGFLKALNELWDLNLSNEKLRQIVSTIGADIPFFIGSQPALVRGIGDIIEPFTLQRDYWVIIIKPKAGLSTKEIYNKFNLSLTLKSTNVNYLKLLESLSFQGLKNVKELNLLSNDLERIGFAVLPSLVAVKDHLKQMNPDACMMSGSGSAFFALFHKEPHYEVKALDPSWFLCTTKVMRGQDANYRD